MPPLRYPSDLSDEEWAILEPLLGRAERRGRPPRWPARRVADAVFYLLTARFTVVDPSDGIQHARSSPGRPRQ